MLPMPVNKFGYGSVVEDIDRDGKTFFEADERSRDRSVVSRGFNDVPLGDFELNRRDAEGDLGGTVQPGIVVAASRGGRADACQKQPGRDGDSGEEIAACFLRTIH